MKIGITGHSGFIGGAVAKAIGREGHDVFPLDPYLRSKDPNRFDLKGCPESLDWVLHFAASTSIRQSFEDPFYAYSNNLDSTLLALKIASRSKAAFLFMSSFVYGQPKYLPIDEKHPVSSINPYMGSKIAGEDVCRSISETLAIPLIILRGSNIFGNCNISGRLICGLLESARNGLPFVLNDPEPRRDYLYVKDFQSLVIKIVSAGLPEPGIYNVGYGKDYSNIEVAEMARRLSGNKFEIVVKRNSRPNDILNCRIDVELVKKAFHWAPGYTLESALRELIEMQPKQINTGV